MQIEANTITLSSGRKLTAYAGVIGLSPSLAIMGGYDGTIWEKGEDNGWDEEDENLTPEERVELADYMISQWHRFKAEHCPPPPTPAETETKEAEAIQAWVDYGAKLKLKLKAEPEPDEPKHHNERNPLG